jgi:ribokinase
MTGRVLVVGSANIDVVLTMHRLPEPGETVLGGASQRGYGGKGANQAVAAARAGARTSLLGRVGGDESGAAYRQRLQDLGVDVEHLLATPGAATGTAYVLVDAAGENSIVVVPGANGEVGAEDLEALDDLGPGDVLLAQCELPLDVVAAAVRRARARGARVVLNLAPYQPVPADLVELADPVVVNDTEAGLLRASGLSPRSLVVTHGKDGASWGDLERPAVTVPPDEVVDTTGAGDAFCGALAAALAAGADPGDALRLALLAGADAVRRIGAQPAP